MSQEQRDRQVQRIKNDLDLPKTDPAYIVVAKVLDAFYRETEWHEADRMIQEYRGYRKESQ